jgi:protein-tyrosine phosphatase
LLFELTRLNLSPDRIKEVEGSINLRDFGGYLTSDGKRVARDKLFRSGNLHFLTADGEAAFVGLNIGLVCYLRRADEKSREPTRVLTAKLEIPIDPGSAIEMRARLRDSKLGYDERIHFMTELTRELTQDHANEYGVMFEHILSNNALANGQGFLVHCSAGKDRTGVAAALILHALGVPDEDIIADYLFTNEAVDYEQSILPRIIAMQGAEDLPSRQLIMTIAGVREEYLRAAYEAIYALDGTVEAYLRQSIGLADQDLLHLRRRYTR